MASQIQMCNPNIFHIKLDIGIYMEMTSYHSGVLGVGYPMHYDGGVSGALWWWGIWCIMMVGYPMHYDDGVSGALWWWGIRYIMMVGYLVHYDGGVSGALWWWGIWCIMMVGVSHRFIMMGSIYLINEEWSLFINTSCSSYTNLFGVMIMCIWSP